ncbi:MAG TPA: 7-cyano-7-deazaguanine synthase QueC [Methanothermococcus okinawensis]|uniref:7-cyano-7-deazaguanine synthase n=1 Tax=Methanothermococcus okinawensis TaxID=155863 RepID=A0A833E460_9EURY|nr:7-cyano-7-deazaguanine synthase QueC [Methanothermococcus okinawensis]HIP91340.1 7-cyano-7-deazaguanine synthase QueC [Methanothermococcus okinawensis]
MVKVCVLSGGLDSTVATLAAKLEGDDIYTLTFDYGQRAAIREINAARKISEVLGAKHKIIKLPFLREFGGSALTERDRSVPELKEEELDNLEITRETMRSVWVPGRNLVMFSIASSFAESLGGGEVYTGLNREEGTTFPDNTLEFVDRFNHLLEYSTIRDVKLIAPLYNLDKAEIIRYGRELEEKLGVEVLKYSYSCYHDNGEDFLHCGVCESCVRRKRAFKEAGVKDPTKYLR